jgi:hypothetical protein
LKPTTLKWCKSIQKPVHYAPAYSTAFRCLHDILERPIKELYVIGMDFHKVNKMSQSDAKWNLSNGRILQWRNRFRLRNRGIDFLGFGSN